MSTNRSAHAVFEIGPGSEANALHHIANMFSKAGICMEMAVVLASVVTVVARTTHYIANR